uniref:Ovule protein n=1 Tax=Panagrolaimus sp. PS1159 TaxID=55785 RepID=A0AC35G7V7_9BILA
MKRRRSARYLLQHIRNKQVSHPYHVILFMAHICYLSNSHTLMNRKICFCLQGSTKFSRTIIIIQRSFFESTSFFHFLF